LDCKNGKIYEGPAQGVKVDTTLTVTDEDMVDIALGKLNPQSAFMKGKLKIAGNIMLTQKLAPFLKQIFCNNQQTVLLNKIHFFSRIFSVLILHISLYIQL